MAARRERGLFDPDAAPGQSPFDHYIYVIASDGDIEEGVTSEASSLAGRQQLGNLIVIYDDNKISIEDDTKIALSEDTAKRYEAYGWHVQVVEGGENVTGILAGAGERQGGDRPAVVHPAAHGDRLPGADQDEHRQGARLGAGRRRGGRGQEDPRLRPDRSFEVDDEVLGTRREVVDRGREAHERVAEDLRRLGRRANPERKPSCSTGCSAASCRIGWAEGAAVLGVGPEGRGDPQGLRGGAQRARRRAARAVGRLGRPGRVATTPRWRAPTRSARPATATTMWKAHPYGRTLHFGVREHAMGAILNGIALHGPTRPYGGTFLIFSDYMRPAVRLAALMQASGRSTCGRTTRSGSARTARPTSRSSTWPRCAPSPGWRGPARRRQRDRVRLAGHAGAAGGPGGLALTRQNLPVLEGTSAEGVARGRLRAGRRRPPAIPQVILIATGSELQIAVEARELLEAEGIATRVVSMPCVEWFDAQDAELPRVGAARRGDAPG